MSARERRTGTAAGARGRDPEQIREDIEQTREELGDTVAAVAEKTDVKDGKRQAEGASRTPKRLAIEKPMPSWLFRRDGGCCRDRAPVIPATRRRVRATGARPARATTPDRHRPRPGCFATLKRTATEFIEDNMTDWAAALTYYGLLALFPALIALVSLVGLVGDPQSTTADDHRHRHPDRARVGGRHVRRPDRVDHLEPGAAGIAVRRRPRARRCGRPRATSARSCAPSNVIYETPEGRPFWKLRPLQLARHAGDDRAAGAARAGARPHRPGRRRRRRPARHRRHRGRRLEHRQVAGDGRRSSSLMFAVLYYASPNVKLRGFKWVTPGQPGRDRRLDRSPRPPSPSTSPTSAPTTRPTAPSAASSPCWSGSGSRNLAILFGHRAERRARAQPRDRRGRRGPSGRSSSSRATSRRSRGPPDLAYEAS